MGIFDGILGSVFGGLLGGGGAVYSADKSENTAYAQMQFQREQSMNQHQRAVTDLAAAGLNPMLSVMHGGNAVGSVGGMPQYPNAGEAGVRGAKEFAQGEVERAVVDKTKAETENVKADTAMKVEQAPLYKQHTAQSVQETARINADHNRLIQEVNKLYMQQRVLRSEAAKNEFYNDHILPVEAAIKNTEEQLIRLDLPKASAEAEAWRSRGGFRTGLEDVSKVAGAASSAASAAAAGRFAGQGLRPNSGRGLRSRR